MSRKYNPKLIPKYTANHHFPRIQLSPLLRKSPLANLNLNPIGNKPKGGKKLNALDYSRKMFQQQQNSAAQFRTQAMQTQQRFRNLEQQRQRTQGLVDSMRQRNEMQRKQQMDWMREGINQRNNEALQRRQRFMDQLKQPITTPEPFKPQVRYEPPSFEPVEPKWGPPIPPQNNPFGGLF